MLHCAPYFLLLVKNPTDLNFSLVMVGGRYNTELYARLDGSHLKLLYFVITSVYAVSNCSIFMTSCIEILHIIAVCYLVDSVVFPHFCSNWIFFIFDSFPREVLTCIYQNHSFLLFSVGIVHHSSVLACTSQCEINHEFINMLFSFCLRATMKIFNDTIANIVLARCF